MGIEGDQITIKHLVLLSQNRITPLIDGLAHEPRNHPRQRHLAPRRT